MRGCNYVAAASIAGLMLVTGPFTRGVCMWGCICILNRYGPAVGTIKLPRRNDIFILGLWGEKKTNVFFFLSFFCFPLERWGSNIKGHFYIVNLFTDSPFAFILEKYVLCQGVAIWPSVSDCPLPTSAESLLAFQRSPHFLVHIHSWSIFFQDGTSTLLQFLAWWRK